MNKFDWFWYNLSIAYYGDCGKYDSYEDKYPLDHNPDECYQCPYYIQPSDYIGEIYNPEDYPGYCPD